MYCKIQFQFPDISIYLPLEISTYLKGFLFPSTLAVQFNTWAVLGPLTCHLATSNTRATRVFLAFEFNHLCFASPSASPWTPLQWASQQLTIHTIIEKTTFSVFIFLYAIVLIIFGKYNDFFYLPYLILYWKTWNVTPILDTEHLHCKWWPKPESKVPLSSLANQLNSSTPGLIRLRGPKVTGCGCY